MTKRGFAKLLEYIGSLAFGIGCLSLFGLCLAMGLGYSMTVCMFVASVFGGSLGLMLGIFIALW